MIVIFDWDGTLSDSLDQIVAAMQAAAAELGISVPDVVSVREVVGLGLPEAVARLFPELCRERNDALRASYGRHFVEQEQGVPRLYPGARRVLNTLRHRGLELAVATGKSRRGLDRVLGRLKMDDYFEATRCADETRSKPHPLMIEEILRERDKPSAEAVVVGDTEYDLEMAARAGVASVGVSFGVHSVARLQRHRPLAVIDHLDDLLELHLLR